MTPVSPWFYRPRPRPDARARLFCFHHAGAGAAVFRLWPAGLPDALEVFAVHLPGREMRIRDPLLRSIPEIVRSLLPALENHLDLPFAFFGHSMGAVVAHEMTHALELRGGAMPQHLIVSGRRPPHVPDPRPSFGHLSDKEFAAEINRRYGGIPDELLQHEDVMAMVLSSLRADIVALETHEPARRAPLGLPITVYGGTEDHLAPAEHLSAWRAETVSDFRVREFAGDHFFLKPRADEVLADLSSTLAPLLRAPQPQPAERPA